MHGLLITFMKPSTPSHAKSNHPGGTSDRPLASLVGILSAWCPQTSANPETRIRIIKGLLIRFPDIGRRVLLKLIPGGHDIQTEHHGPRFRDWKMAATAIPGEQARTVERVVDLLLDDANQSRDHYPDLINRADRLSSGHRRQLVDQLTSLSDVLDDDTRRTAIHEPLRYLIARHRGIRMQYGHSGIRTTGP